MVAPSVVGGRVAAKPPSTLLAPCRPLKPAFSCVPYTSACSLHNSERRAKPQSTRSIVCQAVDVATAPAPQEAAPTTSGTTGPSQAYPFPCIEKKWQDYWLANKTFRTPEKVDTSKPKYYVLDMFPYPRCVLRPPSPLPAACATLQQPYRCHSRSSWEWQCADWVQRASSAR